MVNSERRVTLCPAFRGAPGEARADWQVFAELGRRLGFVKQFSYGSTAEVYGELVALSAGRLCDTSGLSHDLLRQEGRNSGPSLLAPPPAAAVAGFTSKATSHPHGSGTVHGGSARGLG